MSAPRQREAQQQRLGLWDAVFSGDVKTAAAAVAALAASRAAPPGPSHVAALLGLAQPGSPTVVLLPTLTLLSRWARQQSLQPAAARQPDLLHGAAAAAQDLLANRLAAASAEQARVAAACLLLLGSVGPAATEEGEAEALAHAVGAALVGGRLVKPEAATAADAMAAVGSLLPCLLGKPAAACRLLSALLQWLGDWAPAETGCLAVDCLAPAYGMMRGAATAVLGRTQPAAAVSGLLRPAYAVLKSAATAVADNAGGQVLQQPVVTQASVATLAAGGLVEALLRSAAGFPEAAALAAEAEACIVETCSAAAAAESLAESALLRDACSLAAAQLVGAVRRPALLASPGIVRCQAQSLLHSALSLAPLCHAAEVQLPPSQASQLVQRQLGCGLVQHAGGMASGLSAQLGQMDAGMLQWVVQQVQAAARQAHQHYRGYSLVPPQGWLAAIDAAAVRLLLDKLFLTCLVLLVAALEAGPVPSAANAAPAATAGRAQRAGAAAVVLADLQFCRLSFPPQYAVLLKAALAELPDNPAAAASLAACLPCYAELAGPCATRGRQAAWLVDGAAAAKVQFVMSVLTSCCPVLPRSKLEERLAPVAFLYLLHPHPATATSAHNLLCALLMAAAEERRPPLAAYYVQRSLEGCPGATPLPQLAQGLATVMEALPVRSPVALLCLQQVLDKCWELAAWGDPSAPELAAIAAQQLLIIDHLLLDEAMAAFDRLLHPARSLGATAGTTASPLPSAAPAAAVLRREVLAAVRRSDDCLRKPVLASWLLSASANL